MAKRTDNNLSLIQLLQRVTVNIAGSLAFFCFQLTHLDETRSWYTSACFNCSQQLLSNTRAYDKNHSLYYVSIVPKTVCTFIVSKQNMVRQHFQPDSNHCSLSTHVHVQQVHFNLEVKYMHTKYVLYTYTYCTLKIYCRKVPEVCWPCSVLVKQIGLLFTNYKGYYRKLV